MQNYKQNKKAIVLLSGGQDSTTCLYWARANFAQVEAVGFDYGQRHSLELECASDICRELGVEFTKYNLPLISEMTCNALTRQDIEPDLPNRTEVVLDDNNGMAGGCPTCGSHIVVTNDTMPNTFVEGRNLLFLTYATIHAKQVGSLDIVTGVSQVDNSGYPDCKESFIRALEITLSLSTKCMINIHTPLMNLTKAQIWKLANDLGVLDIVRYKTITCYRGVKADGCGMCQACTLRAKGFREFLQTQDRGNQGN